MPDISPERPKAELKLERQLQLHLPAGQKHKYKYILQYNTYCWLSKKRIRFPTDSSYQLKRWWDIVTSFSLVLPSGQKIYYYVFIAACLTPFPLGFTCHFTPEYTCVHSCIHLVGLPSANIRKEEEANTTHSIAAHCLVLMHLCSHTNQTDRTRVVCSQIRAWDPVMWKHP